MPTAPKTNSPTPAPMRIDRAWRSRRGCNAAANAIMPAAANKRQLR